MADRQFFAHGAFFDCFGGPETYTIKKDAGSRVVRFEWSDMFGPLPVTATGEGRNLPPGHWFWPAVTRWAQEGRRVDEFNRARTDTKEAEHAHPANER